MSRRNAAIALACAVALAGSIADAKPHRQRQQIDCDNNGKCIAVELSAARQRASHHIAGDPRPRAWCGWWMRQYLGVADRAGNLARWWARYGSNAHGPAIGAIVVWQHHVGIITGRTATGFIVKSGNDNHAVRERERSLRGAIAFRWPNGVASR